MKGASFNITFLILIIILIIILILASVIHAEDSSEQTNYASLKLGIYYQSSILKPDSNSDLCGDLTYGKYIFPFLATEGSIGFWGSNIMSPLILSLRICMMNGVYIIAGGGLYYTKIEDYQSWFTKVEEKDSWNFGEHTGVGMNFNFNSMYIGAEWRYMWLKADGPYDQSFDLDRNTATVNIGYRF